MAISGVFGLRNLQKLVITGKFPDEIYAEIPAQVSISLISERKFLPHYLLTLHIDGSQADFHLLEQGKKRTMKILLTFKERGYGKINKIAVSSPFPVNFFVRCNILKADAEYLVFPKPLPLPTGWSGESLIAGGLTSDQRKGVNGETGSIGQYTEAEPLKQIHWKLSARHDELLVKEMSAEAGKPVIIEPDNLPGNLEERLGHAVWLINSLMLEGRAVGLKTAAVSLPPGVSRTHRLKMLAELSFHAED